MNKEMNVYQKLIKVQNELKAPKTQVNKFGGYKYRNCEDILEALKPILLGYESTIIISDEIINISDRFYIKSTVTFVDCETGKSITTTALAREAISKKGMDESQLTGSTSSYARKYALNGMFAIDDTKDSDTTNIGTPANKNIPPENKNTPPENKNTTAENKNTPPASQTVSQSQLKRYFAIGKAKECDMTQIDELILKAFNLQSKKDWLVKDYTKFTDYMQQKNSQEIVSMLMKKYEKNKKENFICIN